MSKLSPSLKALINAPFARPGPRAAPAAVAEVYKAIAWDARGRKIGVRPWLAVSAAATFTLNSPDSLSILHSVAAAEKSNNKLGEIRTAEFIREVGLKCISFNGIPRSINCLNAFHAALPPHITSALSTAPSRTPTAANLEATKSRGRTLWNSVYAPFEDKLYEKLGVSHPDLPVVILNNHYGPLLADPPVEERDGKESVGRAVTSLVAIACLRAQTGVGPQVLSHVFGLRKAVEDGTYESDVEDEEEQRAVEWLAGDEGGEWILKTVDRIAEVLGGSNFAGRQSKL